MPVYCQSPQVAGLRHWLEALAQLERQAHLVAHRLAAEHHVEAAHRHHHEVARPRLHDAAEHHRPMVATEVAEATATAMAVATAADSIHSHVNSPSHCVELPLRLAPSHASLGRLSALALRFASTIGCSQPVSTST